MSEHTPGPWEVGYKRGGIEEVIVHGLFHGEYIAMILDARLPGEKEPNYAEMDANTYLIVAAPDLLEVAIQGRKIEDVYLSEIQRLCGVDTELSVDAQVELHKLRQNRENAITKAREGKYD